MAVESLASINSGAMESSLSPKFTEMNTEASEKALMPKFSESVSETKQSKDMPVFKDDTSNIQKDENGHIRTRNEGLEGQNHPVTNIPFKEKAVLTDIGEEVIGVFPEFDSVFDNIRTTRKKSLAPRCAHIANKRAAADGWLR